MNSQNSYPEPNTERLLEDFLTLVQIDSLSYHEATIANWIKDKLSQFGCEVLFDKTTEITGSNTGNMIATFPATPGLSGKLFFSTHMDTVGPGQGIEPVINDGILSSKGKTILGGDDKVGIAAIIEMVRTLAETKTPHPEIVMLFSVAEEVGLKGSSAMDGEALGFNGEPCFVLDADGKPGGVIIGAPFHVEFTARFIGKAVHAGMAPETGVSAINMAAKAITAIPLGRIDAISTSNIGTINGGAANNIVADSCTVTGEMRSLEKARLDEIQAQIAQTIEDTAIEGGGQVQTEFVLAYHGFKLSENDIPVRLVLEAAQDLGLSTETRYTGGGSDANIFAGKGLSPVVLSTGMTAIHSLDESLAISDMEDLTRLIIAIAARY
ncbi:MAG: M20/M25/M40 family metallo-hydrolase [Coriobacteriales bacterium]|jgi:tripeptide aminopeptidase|nr:M20/M25/M40 family metallo-hydrolase [Coriobacteriales bacterium]